MLNLLSEKRARDARHRTEAKALVENYGDRAESYVREKIAASAWHIRNLEHWQRIEKHVRKLLKR